jgi:hypothetical protein
MQIQVLDDRDGCRNQARREGMSVQTLTQDELDDAYHRGVFDCDQALADGIRGAFRARQERMASIGVSPTLWNSIRDDIHNAIAQAFGDCEVKHMGTKRYDAMVERLTAGRKPEGSPQ